LASQVSNISFTDWAILSSVSALWVHTFSISPKIFCVAPLLVVRRRKKIKKEKKYFIQEKEEK
jgi:hypothetical protein